MAKKEVKPEVVLDRMRYVKDSFPSSCALISIIFNVLYFVLIYKINMDYFYNALMGLSVVVNLIVMLLCFWCSEEVKNYHGKFGYVMIAVGAIEIIRIFIYPFNAHFTDVIVGDSMIKAMNNIQFIKSIIYLTGAALFLVVGGITSIKNSNKLQRHLKSLAK